MEKEATKLVENTQLDYKDRVYILTSESTPITFQLRSRHTKYNPLLYFDGESNRALRYASNQKSCFVDSQDDNVVLGTIVFSDGKLVVKKEFRQLQEMLSIYHPDRDVVYKEFDPEETALDDVESMRDSITAQASALEMDIVDLEAVARVIFRSKVDKLTSSEIKRDMLIYAKNNPSKFLELANDSSIKLRNLAIRAVDLGLIGIKDDNTTIYWKDSGDIIIKIKYGDNPYTSLASYFQTDEGIDIMNNLMLKLS